MPMGESCLKNSLSYSLYHQLSNSENPIEIGLAVPDIIQNKETDTDKIVKNDIWYIFGMYRLYIHISFRKKRLF